MKPMLRTRLLWAGARVKQGAQGIGRRFRVGASPDLLIVGAQKAGTTSLFNYLAARPGFIGAQRKEVRFFNRDEHYARGVAWYERFFDARQSGVRFEATPEYLYHPTAPERIHAHYPDVRIVMVLREPVARAYSAWNMYRHWAETGFMPLALWQSRHDNPLYRLFFEGKPPSFEEYVEHEMQLIGLAEPPLEPGILRRGLYADQVVRYLDCFGSRQVLVLGFRELVEQPDHAVDTVAAFARAGGHESSSAGSVVPAHNTGTYPRDCPEPVARRLQSFYQPHNERLRQLLGREVKW